MILIKNAQVFAPKALGKKDVLLAYDKILEIADCIEPWRDDLTVNPDAGIPAFQGRYLRRDDARRSAWHRRLHQEP